MRWSTERYSGWARSQWAEGEISRPELRADVTTASAPAHGNRRSYGDAALNDGGRAFDLSRMDRILSFDPINGLLEVEAGVRLGEILRLFARRGWVPAVLPGTGFATVGGSIAMDVHGKNHHIAGSFGQHVTRIELLTGNKRRVIMPQNTTLWRSTIGGLGQTGIILSATLQLKACRSSALFVEERRAENWDEHISMLDASTASYAVGWIDATATGASLGRGVVEEAEIGGALPPPKEKTRAIPLDAPNFALSAPIVKAFNALYYHRIPVQGRRVTRPMADFFFPLDRIHDWNRLYGKRGFHQFQCVVPLATKDRLKDMLLLIADSGLASPLSVLKRMGEGRAGYLSFPMEGYTLAVDFPAREATAPLISKLEDMTVDAGGRIYLAKDSLATGERVIAMYPDWKKWRTAVNRADPDHLLETDMTRRLNLRNVE